MFGEDGNTSSRSSNGDEQDENQQVVDKVAIHNRFLELKRDYNTCKS